MATCFFFLPHTLKEHPVFPLSEEVVTDENRLSTVLLRKTEILVEEVLHLLLCGAVGGSDFLLEEPVFQAPPLLIRHIVQSQVFLTLILLERKTFQPLLETPIATRATPHVQEMTHPKLPMKLRIVPVQLFQGDQVADSAFHISSRSTPNLGVDFLFSLQLKRGTDVVGVRKFV